MNRIPESDRLDVVYAHLLSLPLRFAEPIMFGLHHNEVGEANASMDSATATLVDIRGKRRVVINDHVLQAYRNAVRDNKTSGKVRVQIGSEQIPDLESLVLDSNATSDLAVLDATNLNLFREEASDIIADRPFGQRAPDGTFVPLQFHKPSPWPATDIRPNDVLIFGGYPEFIRKRDGIDVTHSSWSMAGMAVNGGAFEEFTVRLDRERWQNYFGDINDPILLSRQLSGLSGSPVFVDRGAELTMACSLVGFVKAYEQNDDIFVITSATNMRSDGTLRARPTPIILNDGESER